MYQINDLVVYSNGEICNVFNIGTPDFIKTDDKYYILQIVNTPDNMIYAKTTTADSSLRYIITNQEAQVLINGFKTTNPLYNPNNKLREKEYLVAFQSCEPIQWMEMFKGITIEQKKKQALGKRLNTNDERQLNKVKKCLVTEFSLALAISRENTLDLLISSMF